MNYEYERTANPLFFFKFFDSGMLFLGAIPKKTLPDE
jgi:hypothetical protein